MKLSNIRPNFSEMPEPLQRQFFWNYAASRSNDFQTSNLVTIKQKKSSPKEPKLQLTPAQVALLKTLNLI